MLWSGKAIADVPFLCYRIERVEYFTQNDKDVVMFAFQGSALASSFLKSSSWLISSSR